MLFLKNPNVERFSAAIDELDSLDITVVSESFHTDEISEITGDEEALISTLKKLIPWRKRTV